MIFSDISYNGITFSRFVRGSGFQATAVPIDEAQIRSTVDALAGQNGVQRYIDFLGARNVHLQGFIKGLSEADLYEKERKVRNAFDIKALEASTSGSYGFLPLTWTDPGQPTTFYYMKPIQNTLNISESRSGLSRAFSVILGAKDPTLYAVNTSSLLITVNATNNQSFTGSILPATLPMVVGTAFKNKGTSGFPATFPMAFSGNSFYADGTLNNTGSVAVSPVSITLTAPTASSWNGPKITNLTTGKYLQFSSSVVIPAGGTLTIDFIQGTAVTKTTTGTITNVVASLVTGSSFFTLQPGANSLRIEGTTLPDQAFATISYNPSS